MTGWKSPNHEWRCILLLLNTGICHPAMLVFLGGWYKLNLYKSSSQDSSHHQDSDQFYLEIPTKAFTCHVCNWLGGKASSQAKFGVGIDHPSHIRFASARRRPPLTTGPFIGHFVNGSWSLSKNTFKTETAVVGYLLGSILHSYYLVICISILVVELNSHCFWVAWGDTVVYETAIHKLTMPVPFYIAWQSFEGHETNYD